MSKASQLWLFEIVSFAILALIGLGVSWWVLGPTTGSWLKNLWPRWIPFGVLAALSGLLLGAITINKYPSFRNNGPDKAFVKDSLGGDVLLIVFCLGFNQIFWGWPGHITDFMGLVIAICTVVSIGGSLTFLATLVAEVLYRLGFYSR